MSVQNSLSVLMAVYEMEKPPFFHQSIESLVQQSRQPDEIIVVQDGPLPQALTDVIAAWMSKISTLRLVTLPKNCGLAVALNHGLKVCRSEYIARMDSDDICYPNRFLEQLRFLENNSEVDLVGSWIDEIDENGRFIKKNVAYPASHEDCLKHFWLRDPVAHPAVVFRKRFFDKAGFYSERHVGANKNEDTNLWFRGFMKGCKFANVSKSLLKFRRTNDFYTRRAGLERGLKILFDRFVINKKLGYGWKGHLGALLYFILGQLPSFSKKLVYHLLR